MANGVADRDPLTLLAVHAHPDDESPRTGGVLARYAAEGIRTVLVTCTNGEFGDGPGALKPGAAGHDPAVVGHTRRRELRDACDLLGVTHLELLGYHDSGMADWDYRNRPDVFCNVPVPVVAARVEELIERHRPQVVVSYDVDDPHQHPDHYHAARATAAAVEASGIPAKFYLIAHPTEYWRNLQQIVARTGGHYPLSPDRQRRAELADRRITTTVDVTSVIERKRAALFAHASQIPQSTFARIPHDDFPQLYGREHFVRIHDRTGTATPEDDLFAGLRTST